MIEILWWIIWSFRILVPRDVFRFFLLCLTSESLCHKVPCWWPWKKSASQDLDSFLKKSQQAWMILGTVRNPFKLWIINDDEIFQCSKAARHRLKQVKMPVDCSSAPKWLMNVFIENFSKLTELDHCCALSTIFIIILERIRVYELLEK